jgi:hypothetical protein
VGVTGSAFIPLIDHYAHCANIDSYAELIPDSILSATKKGRSKKKTLNEDLTTTYFADSLTAMMSQHSSDCAVSAYGVPYDLVITFSLIEVGVFSNTA